MFRLATPDIRLDSVLGIDRALLADLGVDGLLLDVDCTLKRYSEASVRPEVAAWLDGLRAQGVRLCLVSNGVGRRIEPLARSLAIPCIAKACKPLPFRLRTMMKRLGFDRRRTAMVGDQLFADIMAARLAGIRSILVRPMHPEEEPWFTRLTRPLERLVLRRMDGARK